jgi:pimeloyl-ACP methyl ester carboxylesterase
VQRIRSTLLPLLTAGALVSPTHAQDDFCARTGAATPRLETEDLRIASDTPGIELYLRNKRPAQMRTFPADRLVLFVHGATYPAETAFDLRLDGYSWMDYIACRGFDVYLVDVRGYGRSTRPPEMAQPPEANPPIVTTNVAVRDVGSAVDFILARRGVRHLNLIGWSWGTAIMGTYAAANPERAARLVLYAPLWLRQTPSLIGGEGPLGAYRSLTVEQAKQRWLSGVPADKAADLIPKGWFEAWAQATWASDPDSGRWDPPVLRAPNGVIQDGREYWSAGRAYYDPGAITAATLLVHGEWDRDTPGYMAQAIHALLENAARRQLVTVPEATHTLIMEKNRLALFEAAQAFLEAPR